MKNIRRIPLAERLNALPDELYHPFYALFVVDIFDALGTLDSRFTDIFYNELAAYDCRDEHHESNFVAEFLFLTYDLSPDERRLVQYKILIDPFVWLAQQGGAES